MKPAQLQAYRAVCEADPECDSPLLYWDGHAMMGSGAWRDVMDELVPLPMASAAITDHLHTRLMQDDEWDGTVEWNGDFWTALSWNGDFWTALSWTDDSSPDQSVPRCYRTKLSAYLAAHIVRLSLPRELIEKMEEA